MRSADLAHEIRDLKNKVDSVANAIIISIEKQTLAMENMERSLNTFAGLVTHCLNCNKEKDE